MSIYAKLTDIKNIREEVRTLKLVPIPITNLSVNVLIGLEILLVISFLFNILNPWKELFSIVLLLFFSYTLLLKRKITEVSECSCFGESSFLNKRPLLRNMLLIVLCIVSLILPLRVSPFQSYISVLLVIIYILSITLVNKINNFNNMRKIHDNI